MAKDEKKAARWQERIAALVEAIQGVEVLPVRRVMTDDWKWKWNYRRLHSPLGYLTPAIFIAKLTMLNEKVEGKGGQFQNSPPSFRSNVETNRNPKTLDAAGSVCRG